jgi:tetratricopeptide (TPR) repeat protein
MYGATATAAPDRDRTALEVELDSLRRLGKELVAHARYAEALSLYERGLALARELQATDWLDLMVINRAAVRMELRAPADADVVEDGAALREILGRTTSAENGWLASYQLGRLHELRRDHKKALFYARIARDRSAWSADERRRSSAWNLLGNVLLAESHVADALAAYGEALACLPEDEPVRRATIEANAGYCRLLEGDLRAGMATLYRSLRVLRSQRLARYCVLVHVDLAYGHLQLDRPGYAAAHARRALRLLRSHEDPTARQNALFLLGEAQVRLDRVDEARLAFLELQQEFFPDNPGIVRQLLAVDATALLNLRA